jgi:mono/diheme cytochrome c family protein
MKRSRVLVIALVLLGVLGAGLLTGVLTPGVSARRPPRSAEAFLARRIRHIAIPRAERRRQNPEPSSPDVLQEAMEHFADHCASCHGNDGKGRTEIGQNLYPRAPDMTRSDTQRLSDGELFFIIKNGVRFTGMPAWGRETPEDDRASWRLVHFIRHLPKISTDELDAMARANPVSPMEAMERLEAERFLEEGGETAPLPKKRPVHRH